MEMDMDIQNLNLPPTKAAAKATGSKYYFTGKPCPKGHIDKRILHGHCMECMRLRARQFYNQNPSYAREWQKNNRTKSRAATARWRLNHPDKYQENDSKQKRRRKESGLARHDGAMARARALNAIPPWADIDAIKAIYIACPSGMEIDHIYPLRGEATSGLHVANNLQYLTKSENKKKGNRLALESFQ